MEAFYAGAVVALLGGLAFLAYYHAASFKRFANLLQGLMLFIVLGLFCYHFGLIACYDALLPLLKGPQSAALQVFTSLDIRDRTYFLLLGLAGYLWFLEYLRKLFP